MSEPGALAFCRTTGHETEATRERELGALTSLSSTKVGTSQDARRRRESERNSLSGDHRGRGDKSGNGKKTRERNSRAGERKGGNGGDNSGHKRKANERTMGTHGLSNTEAQTTQDTVRKRAGQGYSRSKERRQRDKSERQKEARERRALTSWREQRIGQSRK
jgi:hypothetical protein